MLRRHVNVIIIILFHRIKYVTLTCMYVTFSLCGYITRLQIFALKCDIYKVNEAINCSSLCWMLEWPKLV